VLFLYGQVTVWFGMLATERKMVSFTLLAADTCTCTHLHVCTRVGMHTHMLTRALSHSHQHFTLIWTVAYILFLATLYKKLHQLHRNCFPPQFQFGFRSVLYNNSVSFGSIKNLLFLKKKFYVNTFVYLSFHVCISNCHKKLKLREVNI
jgi:hypothetical protein